MFPYPALLGAQRNPFSSRKRVSGCPPHGAAAAEDGSGSNNMRIRDSRLARIQTAPTGIPSALPKSGDFGYELPRLSATGTNLFLLGKRG